MEYINMPQGGSVSMLHSTQGGSWKPLSAASAETKTRVPKKPEEVDICMVFVIIPMGILSLFKKIR